MQRHFLFIVVVISTLAGCIPDKLCDTVSKDNKCDSNTDCVVAFCAADCDNCRVVVSQKQADRAYCLVIDGEEIPSRCREAWEELDCNTTLPPICPPPGDPRCIDGECVPVIE
jgi:hypothetical protein